MCAHQRQLLPDHSYSSRSCFHQFLNVGPAAKCSVIAMAVAGGNRIMEDLFGSKSLKKKDGVISVGAANGQQ